MKGSGQQMMARTQTLPPGGSPDKKSRANIPLWIFQVLLAAFFGMAGFQKAFRPLDVIAVAIFWVPDVSPLLVRFIGISEFLGAIGLIVPAATKIYPKLTALAAAGLSLIMVLASAFHIVRGEMFALPMTLIVCALAAFVAYGRWKLAPIQRRG